MNVNQGHKKNKKQKNMQVSYMVWLWQFTCIVILSSVKYRENDEVVKCKEKPRLA